MEDLLWQKLKELIKELGQNPDIKKLEVKEEEE